jgi:hypothetical protein
MTIRMIFGLGWSLVIGLAGGWLAVAPWVLGEQISGDWTTVTKNELGLGVGLVVLALVGIGLVAGQAAAALRAAGVIAGAPRASAHGPGSTVTGSPEMEQALIALAQALAQDLDSQRVPATTGRPPTSEQPSVAGWRDPP